MVTGRLPPEAEGFIAPSRTSSASRLNLEPEAEIALAPGNPPPPLPLPLLCWGAKAEMGRGAGTASAPDCLLRRQDGTHFASKSMAGLTIGIMMGSTSACIITQVWCKPQFIQHNGPYLTYVLRPGQGAQPRQEHSPAFRQ